MTPGLVIALPKGKLLVTAIAALRKIGIFSRTLTPRARRLIHSSRETGHRMMIIRAIDVPTYVEYGAADLGIVGKDVLLEQGRDVYEPLDLGFGRCRLVVAAPRNGNRGRRSPTKLRVATKYPNVTEQHFSRKGVPIEIIKLYGSVELAPAAGLCDRIVDLSSTGRTLRDNGLVELEEIAECTARLIVNRAGLKLKHREVSEIIRKLKALGTRKR